METGDGVIFSPFTPSPHLPVTKGAKPEPVRTDSPSRMVEPA